MILIFGRNEFFGRSEVKFLVEMSLIFDFWSKGSLLFDMFICYLLFVICLFGLLSRTSFHLLNMGSKDWHQQSYKFDTRLLQECHLCNLLNLCIVIGSPTSRNQEDEIEILLTQRWSGGA